MTGADGQSPDSEAITDIDVDTSADALWLEVGTIGRAHGLKGEVVVDFVTDRTEERTQAGAELRLGARTLVVATARPHQRKWLVRFEGVGDRSAAEKLRGGVLEAEALDDPDALFVHDLIGKTLIDQHGTRHGSVVAVVENPASDLLELEDGRLVPLVFVVDTDGDGDGDDDADGIDDDVILVSVPPGLLDDDTLG